jgi:hypothetical protein
MTENVDIQGMGGIGDEDYERYLLKDPYEGKRKAAPKEKRAKSGRRLGRLARVLIITIAVLLVGGAGGFGLYSWLQPPNITAYADQGITISGLESQDFIVTPAELLELEIVTETASGTGGGQMGESKAGTITSYGPYMETFLQSHGHTLGDFGRIRILCKDGYSVTYRPELLEGEIIMSVADDKSPLANYQRPLRMVIPGDKTGNWAFGVLRIEFVK